MNCQFDQDQAAVILREYARSIRESMTIVGSDPPDWDGAVAVKAEHDDYLALADRLEQIAPLADLEREAIHRAVAKFNGDKPKAAKSLGISLKTIYNRLNHYAAQKAMAV